MHPLGTAPYRAAIVARTRFVEDLLITEDIGQYVLLGAGLDTYAQRHPERAARISVFEVDAPGPQEWKRRRLNDLGYSVPNLVPVDFESDDDWFAALVDAGFDSGMRSLTSSSGVSMYITKDATRATLERLAGLAPGSILAMTFMLPIELADEADRPGLEGAARGARASGTPWISFYEPEEMLAMASEAGFKTVDHLPTSTVADPYLSGRSDGLKAASGESLLLART
jgi:methyltransferase (TIGR00027 family)